MCVCVCVLPQVIGDTGCGRPRSASSICRVQIQAECPSRAGAGGRMAWLGVKGIQQHWGVLEDSQPNKHGDTLNQLNAVFICSYLCQSYVVVCSYMNVVCFRSVVPFQTLQLIQSEVKNVGHVMVGTP